MSAVLQSQSSLRPMTLMDVESVMCIEKASYEFPWTHGIFCDCLRVGYVCLVYEIDGVITAYAVMSMGAGEAHILTLVVQHAYRGQGIGKMMMSHLLTVAGKNNVDTVLLEVRPSNHVAISLYQGLGFNEVGIRPKYYPSRRGREDAMIMALALN